MVEVLYHHAKFGGDRISPGAGRRKTLSFLSVCHAFEHAVRNWRIPGQPNCDIHLFLIINPSLDTDQYLPPASPPWLHVKKHCHRELQISATVTTLVVLSLSLFAVKLM